MSINGMLSQTGVLYPKTGYNKFGRDESGSGGVTVACRFQNQTKTKLVAQGQVVQLLGVVYFKGSVSVNTEDRFVINSLSYKIFSVNGNIDGRGVQRMIKCEVTKWQTT